jgi:hypothetical protein
MTARAGMHDHLVGRHQMLKSTLPEALPSNREPDQCAAPGPGRRGYPTVMTP